MFNNKKQVSIPLHPKGWSFLETDYNEASFEKRNHPLWLYFQNGYDDTDDILPISISKNPQLLVPVEHVNINHDDIEKIKMFIVKNFELLEKYGCGNISHTNLFKFLKKVNDENDSNTLKHDIIDQNSDKTVKVNFEYIEEKIYLTVTSDNETNSAILYNQLLKNELFKKYDSDTLYVLNQYYDRDQFVNTLLKIIKSTSKANNMNVKFLNTQSIIF